MKNVKNEIESYGFVYLIMSIFMVSIIIPNIASPETAEITISKLFNGFNFFDINSVFIIIVLYLIHAMYYFCCYRLFKNINTKKTNYSFVYILIIIGILVNVYELVMNFSLTPLLGLIVSIVGFCFIIGSKKKGLRNS